MEAIPLEPVDALTVTTLIDNVTDLLLVDEGPAKRPPAVARGRARRAMRCAPSTASPAW